MLKKYHYILLLLFFITLFFSADLQHTLNLKPTGVHQWRQTDCATYALNYYQNNTPFLKPQMLNQTGTNGYSASEFPLIYFITGKLYHVFGFHEWVFRCVNMLVFFMGLMFLFLIVRKFIGNTIAAMIPVILAGTSPYYFYYGIHFLPNVPAISMCLAGWYFFFTYLENKKAKWIYLTAFFFCLAGLLKVSDLLSFFAAGTCLLYLWISKKQLFTKQQLIHISISGFGLLLINAAWIKYCIWFNAKNGFDLSLLGILPIWNLNSNQIADIWSRFYTSWSLHIFSPLVWILLGCFLLLFIFQFKQMHKMLRSITTILFTGSIIYLLLFFDALYHHDYYMLTPLIAILFLIITVTDFLFKKLATHNSTLKAGISITVLSALIFWCLNYNSKMQHHRLFAPEYKNVSDATSELQPYMRSLGIMRTDKVISVPDKSSNISLYLFNNPGWTEVFTLQTLSIQDKINLGAKYLIIGDSTYLNTTEYIPYLNKQIGNYKNFLIFDLQ